MKLLLRNAGLLSLSFVMSALVNVVPQRFFSAAAPDDKQLLLAITLVLGTFSSLLGVELARRHGYGARPGRNALLAVGAMGAMAWLQLHVAVVALHVGLHVAVRGLGNFLTQELDRRTVALAGLTDRAGNDRIGTGLRFGGMLLGPLWFSSIDVAGPWTLGVLIVLGGLMGGSALTTAGAPASTGQRKAEPLPRHGRLLLAAAVLIYASYYLLASSITYVLMDVHHLASAAQSAGWLISLVFGSAIAATVLLSPVLKRGLATGWMLAAPLCMAVTGAALGQPLPPWAMQAGAVVLGVCFALYMLAFRNHATRKAAEGEPGWVAVFNNLGNTSALTGFALLAALVAAERMLAWPRSITVAAGVVGLGVAGAVTTLLALRRSSSARAP